MNKKIKVKTKEGDLYLNPGWDKRAIIGQLTEDEVKDPRNHKTLMAILHRSANEDEDDDPEGLLEKEADERLNY